MADRIMRMPEPALAGAASRGPPPEDAPFGEPRGTAALGLDRVPAASGVPLPSSSSVAARAVSAGGRPLSDGERNFFEPRFGRDFSAVRIHEDAEAAGAAKAIEARAYTLGNHIALAQGAYRPGSQDGRRLLAHELTHTIQQSDARLGSVQRMAEDGGTAAGRSGGAPGGAPSGTSQGAGPGGRLRVHVLGAEREAGEEAMDRRLELAVERTAERDQGSQLILVDSFAQMVRRLRAHVGAGGCLQSLTVWNHARPIYGDQRIGGRTTFNMETGRFEEHRESFSAAALVGEGTTFDREQVRQLRHLFCCDGQMYWRGCGNVSFYAPEGGPRSELAQDLSQATSERERSRVRHRYERFGGMFHTRQEAEQAGANLLAGRDNRVGAQLWSDALCVPITGTNDLLYPDPDANPAFTIGHGGSEVQVAPSATASCPCDPATGRISGDIPSVLSMRDELEQACPQDALDILHGAIATASRRVTTALDTLNSMTALGPSGPLTSDAQRNAEQALRQAFSFSVDTSLHGVLGMRPQEVAAEHARGQRRLARVIALTSAAQAHLRRYLDAPVCPQPSRRATAPCFACKLDQYPGCDRGAGSQAAAFVTESGGSFRSALSVCPTFFLRARGPGTRRAGRSSIVFHEFTHMAGSVDVIRDESYYGCPVSRSRALPVDPRWFATVWDQNRYEACLRREGYGVEREDLGTDDLLRVADAYRCFLDLFDGSLHDVQPAGLLSVCVGPQNEEEPKQ